MKMELQKIVNLLDATSDDKDLPGFVTEKWVEVYHHSGRDYRVNKEIRIKPPMLRSDLCNFSDAYIVVHLLLLLILQMMQSLMENWLLKTMHHLLTASQK